MSFVALYILVQINRGYHGRAVQARYPRIRGIRRPGGGGGGGGWGHPSVARNPLGKIYWVKSKVFNTSDIGYVGLMWGKLLRRPSPIRGIDGLGLNPTYPTSEVTTDDSKMILHHVENMILVLEKFSTHHSPLSFSD